MARAGTPAMGRVVTAVVAAAAIAGCGSGSSSSSAPATAAGGPPPGTGTVQVRLVNIAFSPASVRVRVGQTVTWTNQDSVDHNVIVAGHHSGPHSATLRAGDTYSFVPHRAGLIRYVCTLHPQMKATLEVRR